MTNQNITFCYMCRNHIGRETEYSEVFTNGYEAILWYLGFGTKLEKMFNRDLYLKTTKHEND